MEYALLGCVIVISIHGETMGFRPFPLKVSMIVMNIDTGAIICTAVMESFPTVSLKSRSHTELFGGITRKQIVSVTVFVSVHAV